MKKINWLIGLLVFVFITVKPVFSQNVAGTLIGYVPAPGQHINILSTGTPFAAEKMTESVSSIVSLGSFGGYIVLKFDNACLNHPGNPYGIDFTIFGNAFSGSSEPGVVWVMQDANQNGLPDDIWYEIAGSSHFFAGTRRNYTVTYSKTSTRDVLWKDNGGKTGFIRANDFNLQEYYPSSEYFSSYPPDSVTFTGTMLRSDFTDSATGEVKLAAPVFGYADSHPRVQAADLSMPDNPYTREVEGAGGDPVDISWAIDSAGNYVDLESVNFVKIVSASLNDAGWLGEISTDVAWVQAASPQPGLSGKEELLVLGNHPSKIILGDTLQLEAFYFVKGRLTGEQVVIASPASEIVSVDASGVLRTHSKGEVQIRFTAGDATEYSMLRVAVPESIRFRTDFSAVYPGDTLELAADVYDDKSAKINLTPRFFTSGNSPGKIISIDDRYYLVALHPGELELTASVDKFDLQQTIAVKVHSKNDKVKVFLSVKTSDENLLPFQSIEAGLSDLNAFVENRQDDYSGFEKVTLFHALVKGLQMAGVPFKFRDDEAAGGNLYLYSAEQDGLFTYGWGGKVNPAAYARAWIVRLNSNQYMNGFNTVPVTDGDTIVLYHVPDILNDWNFTRLMSGKTSVAEGEGVEILLEQTTCSYNDSEIIESGFVPVKNARVEAGNIGFTGESGMIWIIPEGEFPLVVTSGNDALLLTEELVVSAQRTSDLYYLYPNPVKSTLNLTGKSSGVSTGQHLSIKLTGADGIVLIQEEPVSLPFRLDVSELPPGMYQVIVTDGKQQEIHKIIKR